MRHRHLTSGADCLRSRPINRNHCLGAWAIFLGPLRRRCPGASAMLPDDYANEGNGNGQFSSLNNSPSGLQPDFPHGFAPLPPNPQSSPFAGFPPLQSIGLISDSSNQFRPQFFPLNQAALGSSALSNIQSSASGYPAGSVDPTGWIWVQLPPGREEIDPEDAFDPIAPARTEIYLAGAPRSPANSTEQL